MDRLELDRLVFVPAAQQPLKRQGSVASADHRLRMVELLVGQDRRFSVDEIEIRRSGVSYSVDTLEEYARRLPEAELFFVLGADAFGLLDQWRQAPRVVGLARLAVLVRALGDVTVGVPDVDEAGASRLDVVRRVREIGGTGALAPVVLESRRIDVSSTEIRERVRAGRPIRGFVTDAVAQYIDTNGLYR